MFQDTDILQQDFYNIAPARINGLSTVVMKFTSLLSLKRLVAGCMWLTQAEWNR